MKTVYKSMLKTLLNGQVINRNEASKSDWSEQKGIYAIWGNADLRKLLSKEKVKIHAGKHNGGEVVLDMKVAIDRCVKRKDTDKAELICLYVGKTAHLKKRMNNPGHDKKLRELLKLDRKVMRDMMCVSFFQLDCWQERFYSEEFAIGSLLPIRNVQPER